jgi:3-oxoacyl-[acyl-carrier-protein] synthase III
LLVYASVSRGWLEPCTAVAVQKKLGAVQATSFDVLDACASWLRALHVTYAMLKSGAYKNALIVSVEAGMLDFVKFQIADISQLQRYGAASTLGNAATATLMSATPSDDFYFVFRTQCADMNLCMMPMSNYSDFMPELEDEALIADKFMANSTPLLRKTLSSLVETYKNDSHLQNLEYDIMFSHAVSAGLWRVFCRATGLPLEKYFETFAEHGNTAAASVPLGMSLAIERGRLQRGHQVGIGVGSAGITVGFAAFTF